MTDIVDKYKYLFDEIFTQEEMQSTQKEVVFEKPIEIPKPSLYRVSTMTMITGFNCNINLSVVDRYFKKDNIIISMVYGDKPVKSSSIKKKTGRPFFNQATIVVRLDPLKKINVKIFSNGKIQMTGVKKEKEGLYALELILQKLFLTEGKVHLSKLLLSQQIDMLLDKFGYKEIPDYYYMFPEKPPKKSAWYKYNVTPEMIHEEKDKIMEQKRLDKKNYGHTFGKTIDWRSLLLENIREETEKVINIERVYEDLLSFYDNKDVEIHALAVEDPKRIKILPIEIVLINSDFNINFKIKRNILHSILKDKYNIVSRYEPGIYPGVNNKYFWNTNNIGTDKEGQCICKNDCSGKGNGEGDGNCKKITIAAFQSGSIIITGAKHVKHIDNAYAFINRVIKTNYDLVRKIDTPFTDIDTTTKKAPVKKYTRTTDIIYIDLGTLKNQYNSPELLQKFEKHSNIKLPIT